MLVRFIKLRPGSWPALQQTTFSAQETHGQVNVHVISKTMKCFKNIRGLHQVDDGILSVAMET